MTPFQELMNKIKPAIDKARAVADQADTAVLKLDGSVLGDLVAHFPIVGPYVQTVVSAAGALRALIDALDGIVNAEAAPAVTPEPPQASV